ncbi:class I SAM-dependent methyltransferase [Oxynema sp. CENA135]|uniref:class I SAM-dependent methyltransferase n=1 Tax=Oxynema sp. CENA135 TaxID=984206 RepID=UPI001909C5D0|nr:class I SAM-dependent methyltransferase [Oxynema sp. CENA135]MBK4729095.1 class I SAM-dependent methyltransferase [Oxynema sp. CENA135]
MHSNPKLFQTITEIIESRPERRITFAEYMDLALYHEPYGYYASEWSKIGGAGDFITSPHLSCDFGETLAVQFVEMWEILGRPSPFHLVEMGAGQGLICGDVWQYLHENHRDCLQALDYAIVEKSPAMRGFQQGRLNPLAAKMGVKLRWCTWEEVGEESIIGCLFSNELVDAFPVHQVVFEGGQLREIYVTVDGEGFAEVTGDLSTEAIAAYFDRLGIDWSEGHYPEGYRTEVNLAAVDWIDGVAAKLHCGYVLTVDYGYPASRYYAPARDRGTLQCYYRHSHHDNPYLYLGQQDITAHVDFTTLEQRGQARGLETLGWTQQGLFLMALGWGDRLAALSRGENLDISTVLQRREVLHRAIDPLGLGGFGVLVQCKGLDANRRQQSLRGLKTPPMV